MVPHVVLTGTPGAGKTTLLDAAAALGFTTSPEVARDLLRQPGGMALRADDPLGFAEAILAGHRREYERLSGLTNLVVFDRGFPDMVGFLDLEGLPVPRSVDQACRNLRYSGPVWQPPAWEKNLSNRQRTDP
jgi:predicted ATPase